MRDDPTFLTGEHIYPWMPEEYGALRPLAEAAQILAEHEWPALYDFERLAANEVPAAAAISNRPGGRPSCPAYWRSKTRACPACSL